MAAAGRSHRGVSLDDNWVQLHWDEIMTALQPICAKIGTCYATGQNRFLFCNELAQPEMRKICERFPKGSRDMEQCGALVMTWALGIDFEAKAILEETQKCAAEKTPPGTERRFEVWTDPAALPPGFEGNVTFYALDPETRAPVDAQVEVEGPRLFAPATPDGRPSTGWPFKWKATTTRVPNAEGHSDVLPPNVTIVAPGYAPVTMRMPIENRKLVVDMKPATLKPGKSTVTFNVRDSVTGAPVEARVMMGDEVLGYTNEPLEVEVPRGKRPEIWVTDLFNRYGDVVVAKAQP